MRLQCPVLPHRRRHWCSLQLDHWSRALCCRTAVGAAWSWSWADCGSSDITIGRGGMAASKSGDEWRLITGGEAMTAGGGRGREYWEVHISETPNDACGILIGAVTSTT